MIDHAEAALLALDLAAVAKESVVAGSPSTGEIELGRVGAQAYGVWEMTPGSIRDVSEGELVIVLSGRARVQILSEAEPLALEPGSVARLEAGWETVWTVTETLRKVWISIAE